MTIPEQHGTLVTQYLAPAHSEVLSFTMGFFGGGEPATATEYANRFSDIWKDEAITLCASEYTIGTTTCYFNEGGTLTVGVSDRAPYAGTLGAGACSPAVSFLLRKNTGLAGRKFRGRMFAPQPRDVDVDGGGNVLAAQITNWGIAGAAILEAMDDEGIVGFSIGARILHGDATAPTAIVSLTCDPVVGTQRRRQR